MCFFQKHIRKSAGVLLETSPVETNESWVCWFPTCLQIKVGTGVTVYVLIFQLLCPKVEGVELIGEGEKSFGVQIFWDAFWCPHLLGAFTQCLLLSSQVAIG